MHAPDDSGIKVTGYPAGWSVAAIRAAITETDKTLLWVWRQPTVSAKECDPRHGELGGERPR
ncbi:hypothetical protein GCM10018784_69100 [Streptomyces hydrogenans]|nr:hypothetical protein GCM10018784_69100 [Streptomyces hydrogenans]